MKLLFVHQHFSGQVRRLAPALAAQPGAEVLALRLNARRPGLARDLASHTEQSNTGNARQHARARPTRRFIKLAEVLTLAVAASAATASPIRVDATPSLSASSFETMPTEARSVIRNAQATARRGDTQALRKLMAPSFQWNFGPDGATHDAAIQAWRVDPDYLHQMVRVLSKGCVLADLDTISCPGAGGTRFRAGFQRTSDGWKMNYFLAGD